MSVRKSLVWILGSNVAFFLIQFGASIVLARLLTPTEMGIYGVALSVLLFVKAFQNLGLPTYIVRAPVLAPAQLGTVYTVAIGQAGLMAAAIWLLAPAAAAFMDEPRVSSALRLLCIFALIAPIEAINLALVQRRRRFDQLALLNLQRALLGAAVTIVGAYMGWSYNSMAYGMIAGSAGGTLVAGWIAHRELWEVRPCLLHRRDVMHFGTRSLVTVLVANFNMRMPDMLLGSITGVTAVGIYNRGTGMIDIFNSTVLSGFSGLLQSLLVEHRDKGRPLRDVFIRSNRLMCGVAWPLFAGIGVLAGPTISLLFGPQWHAAAPLLMLLSVSSMVNIAFYGRNELFIAVGEFGVPAKLEVARLLATIPLFAVAATFGLIPATASRIVSAGIFLLICLKPLKRVTGASTRDLLENFTSNGILTAAAIFPAMILMSARGWPVSLPVLELFAVVAVGVLCWLGATFLTRHELRFEVERVFRTPYLRWATRH